jgi:phosphoribosylamine--glycine ligase
MNVLIIGSGGREHAIAWKISQSPLCSRLFTAPGNAGTARLGTNIAVKADDFEGIKREVLRENIDFVFVGPDDPLALGIVDFFQQEDELRHVPILGPPATGAQLESSKSFAKAFMERHHIPTATYKVFNERQYEAAVDYVKKHSLPVVIKADGLAAGKGVSVCLTAEEGIEFLKEIFKDKKFGKAGSRVVVEQFLSGIELSVFILTDGEQYILLPEAKDYKRVGEGDNGPNTGGMGAISPVPFADNEFILKVKDRIIQPTLIGLQQEGIPYRGFIFLGLINVDGDPFVIEYNARMGDPETQVVFPRVKSDLLPAFIEAAKGELSHTFIEVNPDSAAAVIAVSGGYPGTFEAGKVISGLDKTEDVLLFHAGTKKQGDELLTSGGRVMAVTALAPSLLEAVNKAYENVDRIHFDQLYYRKDIGLDVIETKQ